MHKNFWKAIFIAISILAFLSFIPITLCILYKKIRIDFSDDIDFDFEDENCEPIIVTDYME